MTENKNFISSFLIVIIFICTGYCSNSGLKKQEELKRGFGNKGENIYNLEWFDSLKENFSREKFKIVTLFNSICESCTSGIILSKLSDLYSHYMKELQITLILPLDFTKNDIENLKNQLCIDFHVINTDDKLDAKWEELKSLTSTNRVLNEVIFCNKEGVIIHVMGKDHNSIDEFFQIVETTVNSRGDKQ